MGEETRAAVTGQGADASTRLEPRPAAASSLKKGGTLSLVFHLLLLGWVLRDPGDSVRIVKAPPTEETAMVSLEIVPREVESPPAPEPPGPALGLPTPKPATPARSVSPRQAGRVRSRVLAASEAPGLAEPSEIAAVAAPEAGQDDDMESDDDDQAPAAPAPGSQVTTAHASTQAPPVPETTGPAHVASYVAAALRLYDHFPRIPEPLRGTPGEYAMMVDVCVSERGQVSQVNISPTGSELLVRTLREAVHTWRYRPLVIAGTPRAFCHVVRVIYRAGSV